MTTITYRKKVGIAADSQITTGNLKTNDCYKLYKDENFIAAAAGKIADIEEFFDILQSIKTVDEISKDLKLEVDALVYFNNKCYYFTNVYYNDETYKFKKRIINNEYFSIGSGSDFALTAMHLGCSITESIVIASKHDIYTNDKINVIYF